MSRCINPAVNLSAVEVASLECVSVRTVQDRCNKKKYIFKAINANGGSQNSISLSSLSEEAKVKYWHEKLIDTFPPGTPSERRFCWVLDLNTEPAIKKRVIDLAGLRAEPVHPLAWSPEESEKQNADLVKKKTQAQEVARNRCHYVRGFAAAMRRAPEDKKTEAGRQYAAEIGLSVATLRRWHKDVRHLAPKDWTAALVPGWKGGREKVELNPDAWQYIKEQYLVASQPNAKYVYQRTCSLAHEKGWAIPSYRIVLARINAIDHSLQTLTRGGKTAFDNLFPGVTRDYSTIGLNEVWCSDGRKADIFCEWPDGHIGRPITVGWIDVRSRYMLGWHVGKVESAEEVRLSYRNAVQCKNALPNEAYLDNGRGYASKMFTGGQTTRNRFKVKEDEITGILTLTGVKAIWATPAHGQAKPIESFWNRIAKGTDRRAEFVNAYCGNKPANRPEGNKPDAHPVPIADYMAALKQDLEAYNLGAHRGDSMDGKSPSMVYSELQAVSVPRAPTKEQLQWCMLAAKSVTLDKKNFSISINGNSYWNEALPNLSSNGPYTARYDADDSTVPVHVFDGETFICAAEIGAKTGFRNQTACKDNARANKAAKRAVKDIAKSLKDQRKARSWDMESPPAVPGTGDASTVQVQKVVKPMRPPKNYKPVKADSRPLVPGESNPYLTPEMERNRDAKLAAMAKQHEGEFINLPRQASGGW